MKVMAIDIGTNSTLHLVADVSGNRVTVIDRGIVGNSLGAKMGSDGILGSQLLKSNLEILRDLADRGRDFNCRNIGAVGTHALRRASNPQDFIETAQAAGVPLEIISDAGEARLTWSGVFGETGAEKPTGLLDLGGGSCELIIGAGNNIEWMNSIPVGAVTLARDHFFHDPPTPGETEEAEATVKKGFAGWKAHSSGDLTLSGVAGTITALAAIKYGLSGYRSGELEGLKLSADDVKQAKSRMLSLNLDQRKALPCMPPARAESIHAGTLILDAILTVIGRSEIIVSERGLLFGLAKKLAQKDAGKF